MGFGSNYTGNPTAVEAPSPAPGAGVAPVIYLPADADGATWANLFQALKTLCDFIAYLTISAVNSAYGTGFDGALVFDGTSVVTLGDGSTLTPIAGVYTLSRDIFPNTCVITGGSINPGGSGAGFRITCRTSFATAGGVVLQRGNTGGNGSAGTGGAAGAAFTAGTLKGGAAGGAGGASGSGGGGNGNDATTAYGGNGGGAFGGVVHPPTGSVGSVEGVVPATMGHIIAAGALTQYMGGAGGQGGSGSTSAAGGGGGAGGPVVCIAAKAIVLLNAGDVQAVGGAGGNAQTGGSPGNGGSGGGGGLVHLICDRFIVTNGTLSGATNSPGGTGGTGAIAGSAGSSGQVKLSRAQ